MSLVYTKIISVCDKFVPTKFKPFWNHPAGPKTIFFWAPTFKWEEQCPFRHEALALGCETVCSFWKNGNCNKDRCGFRHMEIKKNRNRIPCYWETQPGGCLKMHCPFSHIRSKDVRDLRCKLRKKDEEDMCDTTEALVSDDVSQGNDSDQKHVNNGLMEEGSSSDETVKNNNYAGISESGNPLSSKNRWKRKRNEKVENDPSKTKIRICRRGITLSDKRSDTLISVPEYTFLTDASCDMSVTDIEDEVLQSQEILHEIDCLLAE